MLHVLNVEAVALGVAALLLSRLSCATLKDNLSVRSTSAALARHCSSFSRPQDDLRLMDAGTHTPMLLSVSLFALAAVLQFQYGHLDSWEPSVAFTCLFCIGIAVNLHLRRTGHSLYFQKQKLARQSSGFQRRGLGNAPVMAQHSSSRLMFDYCLSTAQLEMLNHTIVAGLALAAIIPAQLDLKTVAKHQAWMLLWLLPLSLYYLIHVNNTTNIGNRKALIILLVFWHIGWTGSRLGLDLLKVHLASWYLAGGWTKLCLSIYLGDCWLSGTTFQSLALEGMLSRPPLDQVTRFAQHTAFRISLLSKGASYFGILLFEGLFCVLAFYDARASVLYGLTMILFHYGVHVLQGINFVDYHSFGAMVFVLAPQPGSLERIVARAAELLGSNDAVENRFGDTLALGFLFAQLVFGFLIGEVLLHVLEVRRSFYPLTCCPMFAVPTNCWDPSEPYAYTLTDANLRNNGQPDYLQWCYSVSKVPEGQWGNHLPDQDLLKFPMRVLQFALTGDDTSHPYSASVMDEYRGKNMILIKANFRPPSVLVDLLVSFGKCLKGGNEVSPWDRQKCDELIVLIDRIQDHFTPGSAEHQAVEESVPMTEPFFHAAAYGQKSGNCNGTKSCPQSNVVNFYVR